MASYICVNWSFVNGECLVIYKPNVDTLFTTIKHDNIDLTLLNTYYSKWTAEL